MSRESVVASPVRAWMRNRREAAVLAVAAVAYVPLVVLGYGSDNDAYLVAESGRRIVEGASYLPSRPPGYPLFEATVGALDALGGSVATNLGTCVLALVAVGAFLALCRRLEVPHRVLLGLTFALHPLVWANAATTMDYVWALGLGLAGGVFLLDRRWTGAGVLLGLAVGMRFTSVLFVVGLVGLAAWRMQGQRDGSRGVLGASVLAGVIGACCYVPAVVHAGGLAAAFQPVGVEEQAAWSWMDYLGRFGYKNAYVWGLPAALLLAATALRVAMGGWRRARPHGAAFGSAVFVVLAYEALFLRYPFEQAYLLPLIPSLLVALGLCVGRRTLAALAVLTLAYNLLSINLARPDRPNHATSVEVGVWVEPGYLATDIAQRLIVRTCRTHACWMERTDVGRFPDLFGGGTESEGGGK